MRYLHNFMDEPQNDYEESLKQAEAAAIGLKGKGLPVETTGVDGEQSKAGQIIHYLNLGLSADEIREITGVHLFPIPDMVAQQGYTLTEAEAAALRNYFSNS